LAFAASGGRRDNRSRRNWAPKKTLGKQIPRGETTGRPKELGIFRGEDDVTNQFTRRNLRKKDWKKKEVGGGENRERPTYF